MKIKIAKTAGFCWGVKRAIDKVVELRGVTSGKIQTFGPLIHNPQELQRLEKKDIKAVKKIKDLKDSTVVIRTHGISPAQRAALKDRDLSILDTTCPDVASIHARVKRSIRAGHHVIIAGHKGHPEIIGLMGYTGGKGHLVEQVKDVDNLPDLEKVSLVSQSTFDKGEFLRIAESVCKRFPGAEIYYTICDATHDRQDEVNRLAREVDVMVVIGGKSSSNTSRLAEVASSLGTPTVHVETESELGADFFEGAEVVGVTAGASTPDWMIERVIKKIEEIGKLQEAASRV